MEWAIVETTATTIILSVLSIDDSWYWYTVTKRIHCTLSSVLRHVQLSDYTLFELFAMKFHDYIRCTFRYAVSLPF